MKMKTITYQEGQEILLIRKDDLDLLFEVVSDTLDELDKFLGSSNGSEPDHLWERLGKLRGLKRTLDMPK